MKKQIIQLSAVALVLGLAAGCASQEDLKKVEDKMAKMEKSLKKKIAKNTDYIKGVDEFAQVTMDSANSAQDTADQALATANMAARKADASQRCCNANSEKINRMFEKSMMK